MADLRVEILETCLERAPEGARFAGGDLANNHLSLDKLDENSDLFERTMSAMTGMVLSHLGGEPAFLAPIPSGGDIIAESISQMARSRGVKLPVVKFQKSDDGLFVPSSGLTRKKMADIEKGVIVDDASTRLSSLARILLTPELAGKDLSFAAIWRRGNKEIEKPIDIPKLWVVEEYIPAMLPDDSPLWQYVSETKPA